MFVEDPSELPVLDADPTPLTNQELAAARVRCADFTVICGYVLLDSGAG
jgi:hypothetical protein